MFDDDDFKISMDDIKDMVSELFGEKIEKIDASKARELLKQDTASFDANAFKITEEEARLLKEYELGAGFDAEPAPAAPVPQSVTDVDALRKKIEEETRLKIEAEMREKIKQELADEQSRKKAEVLKKIETMKQEERAAAAVPAEESAQPASDQMATSHTEKMAIMQMFEQSQKLMFSLLSRLIKVKPVETMFMKTIEKSMAKYPDVLKKVDQNQYGKLRMDGSLELGRMAANVNAIPMPEGKKTGRFLEALRDVFEERLIAIELATGIETKDDLLSNLIIQAEQVFKKRGYTQRAVDLFNGHVVPSTTVKPGE